LQFGGNGSCGEDDIASSSFRKGDDASIEVTIRRLDVVEILIREKIAP